MTSHENVVLVGDDLAMGGAEALEQGQSLAARTNAVLKVVHAIPDPGPIEALLGALDDKSARELARLEEQARAAMRARVERVTNKDIESVVAIGTPHSVVLREAERVRATAIVVGASSSPSADAFFLGGSASQIVRHAPCSVLVARPMPQADIVLVATDLSNPELPAVTAGVREAAERDAELVLLHVLDLAHPLLSGLEPSVVIDEETARELRSSCHETLAGALGRFEAEGKTEVAEGNPKRAIIEVARKLGASLIVVGTHGRTGLSRIALGSVAEAVVRRAPCSVLVVRKP